MKTKSPRRFETLPRDYAGLCRMHLPRPIRDRVAYANALEIAETFAGFEARMSADQHDYFDLLGSLIEAWEAAHVEWKGATPLETLQHLLDEHGLCATELSRILGAHRTLGPMILRGERAITAEHARTLGRHFGLPAGVFIE